MVNFFSGFSWEEIFKASTVLFAVIDIIGSIPLILKLQESAGAINPLRTSLVSMFIMLGFLFLGERILNLFGVTIEAFAVAGAFILFAMALEMILGVKLFRDEVSSKTVSVVPLAFPIIAGAGTMTTLVSIRAEYQEVNIIVSIVLNVLVVYFVLKMMKRIASALGEGGIVIVKKVFGIILLAIAIKLFTSNIGELIQIK